MEVESMIWFLAGALFMLAIIFCFVKWDDRDR